MARAFKDMIVQEADGKPRLTFRNRQGAAVLEDVAVEVSRSCSGGTHITGKVGNSFRETGRGGVGVDLSYG